MTNLLIPSFHLQKLLQAVQSEPIKLQQLCDLASVADIHVCEQEKYLPLRPYLTALNHAVQQQWVLPYLLGRSYSVEDYGIIGYAALTSTDVRNAMALLLDHQDNWNGLLQCHRIAPAEYRLTPRDGNINHLPNLAPLMLGALECFDLYFGASPIVEVNLPFSQQGWQKDMTRQQRLRINNSSMHCSIVLNAEVMSRKLNWHASFIAHKFDHYCQRLLQPDGYRQQLEQQISQLLLRDPAAMPSLEDVAKEMSVSSRTLRRYLQSGDRRFSDVVNELRCQLACSYLSDTELSLTEIARRLGYTETTNFLRAFKRWTDTTPQKFRRSLLTQ